MIVVLEIESNIVTGVAIPGQKQDEPAEVTSQEKRRTKEIHTGKWN